MVEKILGAAFPLESEVGVDEGRVGITGCRIVEVRQLCLEVDACQMVGPAPAIGMADMAINARVINLFILLFLKDSAYSFMERVRRTGCYDFIKLFSRSGCLC